MSDSFAGLELTFALLLRTAWCAAILLLLVWSIQKLAGRWLSPRARYALWLLVAARLVILWTPTSSLSLVGQLENRFASAFESPSSSQTENDLDASSASDVSPVEIALLTEALPASADLAPQNSAAPVASWQWRDIPLWSIVAAVWALGVAIFSIRLGRDFWRLRSAIRSMKPVSEPRVLQLVRRIEQELSWNKPVRVLVSPQIASPAVTGVYPPALLMPALFLEQLSDQDLEHVIRHELTHVKRRDVLVNWLLAGIGAVYWFFPLMRYLLSQLRKTRELACDAAVLRSASAQERKAYGKTLLKIMEMVSEADRPMLTFTVGVAGMVWPIGNFRKESKMMRERLELVVGRNPRSWWTTMSAISLAALLVVVGFTRGQDATPIERVAFDLSPRGVSSTATVLEQSYDLTSTLKLFESPELRGVKGASEALRDWISKIVRDSNWSNPKEVQISWDGATVTVKHSPAGHERLGRAMKALHAAPELQFVLEIRLNSLSAADFEKLDLTDLAHARNEAMPAFVDGINGATDQGNGAREITLRRVVSQQFLLNEDQMLRVQKDLDGFTSHKRMLAPKITALNGQSVSITVGDSHPFITGVELIKGAEQPLVDVLFSGTQMEAQAIALGGEKAWLRLNVKKSEVDAESVKAHADGRVELQSPKLRTISQVAGLEMNVGQTLAIFAKTGPETSKEKVQAVFATLRAAIPAPKAAAIDPDQSRGDAEKLMTVTYPIADVLIYRPRELDNESTAAASRRFAKAELKSFVAMFKENNPEFEKASGRKIECDFDNLAVMLTGTAQDVNCLKEHYYFRKKRMQDAATKFSSAVEIQKSKSSDVDVSDFNLLRIGVEFVPPKYGKTRTANRETSKVTDPNDAAKTEQTIDKALQLTIETRFKDKPLSEALNVIAKGANINIVVDPAALVEAGVQSSEPVSIDTRKKPASIRGALRLILDPLELDFIIKDESLIITGKRQSQSSNTTVAYDVAGSPFIKPLLPDFKKNGKHADEPKVIAAFDKIQTLVKNTIPCFVDGDKGAEIQPFYGNLTVVVSAPVEDQEKIADLIKIMERISLADAEKAFEESKRR